MSDIPRDPKQYFLSIHAGQQATHRGIEKDVISQAIREGTVTNANKPHQYEFVLSLPYHDNPVGVVVDPEDGEIITVEWVKS